MFIIILFFKSEVSIWELPNKAKQIVKELLNTRTGYENNGLSIVKISKISMRIFA